MKEEKIFNLIKEKRNEESLTENEKSLMRSNISLKLDEINSVRLYKSAPSPYTASNILLSLIKIINNLNHKKNMFIAALIAALLSGSVSYAAQGSLPGDILYPVKINVNEGVQDLLAVSPTSQAQLETQKIITRLNEAKLLKEQGKLNTQNKEILTKEVANHIQNFEQEVNSLEQSGKSDEVKSLRNNLGSLISDVTIAANATSSPNSLLSNNQTATSTDAIATTTIQTATSTNNNSTTTNIVTDLTATSTNVMGEDDGDSEGDDSDFFNGIKNNINNASNGNTGNIRNEEGKSFINNTNENKIQSNNEIKRSEGNNSSNTINSQENRVNSNGDNRRGEDND